MPVSFGKIGLIVTALLANTAAGAAMVLADVRGGTAHLTATQIADARSNAPDDAALAVPKTPAPTAGPEVISTPRAIGSGTALADAPANGGMVIRRILPIAGPIAYGQSYWSTAGVPAGPIVITVDLDARVLSVFQGGYEIGATAVLLGSQEKPTPTGVFPITQKDAHHISNLYDAKMPYMMRLTNDGVTIHGAAVALGFASHGCVGVPLDFAKRMFDTAHLGDKVYITRGKQAGLGTSLAS